MMLSKTKKKAKKKTVKKLPPKKIRRVTVNNTEVKTKVVVAGIAHSPGHRRMNKSDEFNPVNQRIKSAAPVAQNVLNTKKTNERRIITGAAVGKTGRIIIKE